MVYVFSRRKPELIFTISAVILLIALTGRLLLGRGVNWTQEPPLTPPVPASERVITDMQDRLRRNPDDVIAYAQLGLALLQRVRETGDPSAYAQAELAFSQALERDPQYLNALIGQGLLALARHQFVEALAWGEQARALNPFGAQAYGIIGDARIELGQYEAARMTIQKMVDTRPDLNAYSRISYFRELHGDLPGAIDAMQRAVTAAGTFTSESALWTQVQLGHLYFKQGDLQAAEETYRQALRFRPDYIYAWAGMARLYVARGEYQQAIEHYQQVADRLPAPKFVIALGELYEVTGQPEKATRQYDLARLMQQLSAEAGVDVDLELTRFEIDHGTDPARALQKAQTIYERRPSIQAADLLAWALYHTGRYIEAQRYSQEALRLGTREAMMHYHAGMIAYALEDTTAAQAHLQKALMINPVFSLRYASQAQALLTELRLIAE